MSIHRLIYICFVVFFPILTFGFDFTATPIPETCNGNGGISFSVSNTDPNGSITYYIYALPNTTTPIASQTYPNSSYIGLTSGDYYVEAREVVGTSFTSQFTTITVANQIVPLTTQNIVPSSVNIACSSNSNLTVNVLAGTAPFSYEIVSPINTPLQSSNVFTNLPPGLYKIKVHDACGVERTKTYTITTNSYALDVSSPVISNLTPPDCNQIIVTNTITPSTGTSIAYPLTIQYTVHDPSGGTTIINQTINSGNPLSQDIATTIPSYLAAYSYDLQILDGCPYTYNFNFPIDNAIDLVENSQSPVDCIKYFTLTASNFIPPYTLNFTNAPAGFNPSSFNTIYPGPYNASANDFGSQTNGVPYGNYSVTITDFCGKTKNITFEIKEPQPSVSAENDGCTSTTGHITLTMDPDSTLTGAILLSGPDISPLSYPYDVSSQIVNGTVVINNLPLGGPYTIQMYDNCPTVIPIQTATINPTLNAGLANTLRPGCDLSYGSISISAKTSTAKLSIITITNAPPAFQALHTLPYDVSFNIRTSTGIFYMDNLPEGSYTFSTLDTCNYTNTITVNIIGYKVTTPTVHEIIGCGFDILLNYVTNGTAGQKFWLQKLIDASTNTWGHPSTGSIYTSGVPNNVNSIVLSNNTTNHNFFYNGTFRIIQTFNTFNSGQNINNGSTIDKMCFNEIYNFNYYDSLEFNDIYRLPCSSSGNLDVVVMATGTGTINYSVYDLNGNLIINNGTNNIFSNLPTGTYIFKIQDQCTTLPKQFNLGQLASLIVATTPSDMLVCNSTDTFNLNSQTQTILGTQNPSLYTVTYFETLLNAQNNVNPITNPTNYQPTVAVQDIYARIIYNTLSNCFETVTFKVYVGQKPILNLINNYHKCDGNNVFIDATLGNSSSTTFVWIDSDSGNTLSTSSVITISQVGTTNLTVTATNTYGSAGSCTNTKNTSVTLSQTPQFDHIDIIDWTENQNSITVYTTSNLDFEYSLDGSTWQTSNTFTGLEPGVYTVYVRDIWQCGTISKTVALFYYQRFFTPNSDGANDVWHIKYSYMEPSMNVFIFDRYGKLIKNFQGNNGYWDGTYNGELLFSDDYWFLVKRADGREHRGHFAMKR